MKRLAVWLLLPILLSGCWDAREVEHIIYSHGIGIDYKNNNIVVYFQTIDFGNIAKKESGAQTGKQKVWIGKGEGKTTNQALGNLLESAPQRIHSGHVNHAIITEAALKKPGLIEDLFDSFDRFPESRQTIWVFGTREPIESIFSNIPVFNLSPLYSLISNPMGKYRQKSFFLPYRLFRFQSSFHEPGSTVLLLEASISDKNWTESEKTYPMLVRDGIFVLNRQSYKGYIAHQKALGLRWMQEKTVQATLSVPTEEKPSSTVLIQRPKNDIIPILTDGRPKFKIRIKAEGDILEMKEAMTEEEIVKAVEKAVKHDVMETYMEALDIQADVYQFSQTLYRENPKAWQKAVVNGELPLSKDSLQSIDVKIKLTSASKLKLLEK